MPRTLEKCLVKRSIWSLFKWCPPLVATSYISFSLRCSNHRRWSWTSGETACSPPTHHHKQHCDCSRVIQIPGHHNFSGPEVGQSHRVHCEKGPAEAVLPSPAEEVQPATGAVDTVLLCHHWVCSLHVNNCLFQFSYQIWPQKTMEGLLSESLVQPSSAVILLQCGASVIITNSLYV